MYMYKYVHLYVIIYCLKIQFPIDITIIACNLTNNYIYNKNEVLALLHCTMGYSHKLYK